MEYTPAVPGLLVLLPRLQNAKAPDAGDRKDKEASAPGRADARGELQDSGGVARAGPARRRRRRFPLGPTYAMLWSAPSMTFWRREVTSCCGVRQVPGLMELERNPRIGRGLFFWGCRRTNGVNTRGGDS